MVDKIRCLLRIYLLVMRNQAVRLFAKRFALVGYACGKLVRMVFFLIFGMVLYKNSVTIGGFTRGELLVCYAVMNVIDVVTQMLFVRGLASLELQIKKGDFDQWLVKPVNTLYWISIHQFDWIDFVTLPGTALYMWYALHALGYVPDAAQVILAVVMTVVGCAIAYGMMLMITSLSFFIDEAENVWWLYRDLVYSARNPPAFFPQSVQFAFTYLIPIFAVISFPGLALIGRLSAPLVLWGCVAAVLSVTLGVLVWRRGLRVYSSASS